MTHYGKRSICFLLLSLLLGACGDISTVASIHAIPCAPSNNEYSQPIDRVTKFYEEAIPLINNDETTYELKRQNVFNRLITLIYQMSDSIDILHSGKTIRITITYISPELAQTIVLNEYLYKRANGFSGNFASQVKNHMSGISKRNEHIFLITILSSSYERDSKSNNYMVIEFPIRLLKLTNTTNTSIFPEHDDHNLEETIVLDRPVNGFISYAMAVENENNGCQLVIDKDIDTRIVLSISNIRVNGTQYNIRPWVFTYTPLIPIELVQNEQKDTFSTLPEIDKCSPNKDALSFSDPKEIGYWVSLARFIWYETTLDP